MFLCAECCFLLLSLIIELSGQPQHVVIGLFRLKVVIRSIYLHQNYGEAKSSLLQRILKIFYL